MAGSRGKLPLFLTYTSRERDQLLRGVGITDYDDINLFHLLCSYVAKRGTPRVAVTDFLTAVTAWARMNRRPNLIGPAGRMAFRRLVTSLERNGYASAEQGLDAVVLRDGELRSGHGERAVVEIEKTYRRMQTDPTGHYPSTAEISIPATALVTVPHTGVTKELIGSQTDTSKILRITFPEEMDLLITPAILGQLMEVARRKVHFYIQNNPGLYNLVVSEMRKIPQFRHTLDQSRLYQHLESRIETPMLFWVYLGLAVVRSRGKEVLEPKFRSGRVSLYQSAHLLHAYWQNEHRIDQEKRQREEDEHALVGWMERSGKGHTLEELQDIRDESGRPLKDKYPDASAFVTETLDRLNTESVAAGGAPVIVSFGDLWMHQSAVIPSLEEEVRMAADYCKRAMEADLRSKLEHRVMDDPAVTLDTGFARAVEALIEAHCGRLMAMLGKPLLVHNIITDLAGSDVGMYRIHGAWFEALDRPVFRRMDRLLGLDREDMVGHVVSGMSLLRRFLLRRRLRLRRPDPRATRIGAAPKTPRPPPTRPETTPGETVVRLGHEKPKTVIVERRRKSAPKTMDEAMDKLKEAMSKRGPT